MRRCIPILIGGLVACGLNLEAPITDQDAAIRPEPGVDGGEPYGDGLRKPEGLTITKVVRFDRGRPPTIKVADSTHAAALPAGDGMALQGGAAFKANPGSGGNLFFRFRGGQWLGRGRNGSTIAAAMRDNGSFGGTYNPTQGGFKDICGAVTEVFPTPNGSSFGGARIEIDRFRYVFADQWNHGLDITKDETFCADSRSDRRPDQSGPPDQGNTDNDGLENEAVIGLRTEADEVSSEFDFDGFYEDAKALVRAPELGDVSVLRRLQVMTYEREPQAIKQFPYNPSRAVPDVRLDVEGAQPSGPFDIGGLDVSNNTRIDRKQASLRWIWHEKTDGKLARFELPEACTSEVCETHAETCKCNLETPANGLCLIVPQEHQSSAKFGTPESCKQGAERITFPLIMIGTAPDEGGGQAIGIYYPFHSWANRAQIKCLKEDGTIAYQEDRRRLVEFGGLFEGRVGGGYDQESEKGVTLQFWKEFTNIALQTRTLGMFHPSSEHGPKPNACKESLWGEMFYLFGTPAQIQAAAHEIHTKVNDPNAGWSTKSYAIDTKR